MLRILIKFFFVAFVLGGGGYWTWRLFQVVPPMQRAQTLLAAKNVFGAQIVLRSIIKADPRNAEAHVMLARTQLATSDWLSAEKEAKILRALRYDRTVVGPMLVRSYAMQKRWPDILAEIPAVASKPEEQGMNLALRSVAYLGLGDLKQAQNLVEAALKLSPESGLVHLQWARTALARKDAEMGLQEVDAALALRPSDPEALETKSGLLMLRRDTVGAISQLDLALNATPLSQELRLARAELLMSIGRDRGAQADVNAIFDITPTNATALFYNAILMFRSRQFADASVEFDKLGAQMDQFPRAYFYRAQIALEFGNTQSALESLDRLLKLQPQDAEGMRLAAQVELAAAKPERALALLSPITGPMSRDPGAIDMQGRAYFMLGRMQEAIESFRRATVIAPTNKDFASHLAAAQTQFGVAPVPGDDAADALQ